MLSHRTTWIALSAAAIVAGCAKTENAPADSSAVVESSTTSTASGTLNLADVAGKWNMKAVPMSGDTTTTNYVLTATGNTDGWTLTFPGRPQPVPVKVKVDGDSVMLSAGPYPSVRRPGIQVTTYSIARLQSGRLNGTTTAHYKTKGADSVLALTTSGARAP